MTKPRPIDLLFVDDDDEYRETAARWLTRHGVAVCEAAAPSAALELAERRDFDVAVFDLLMPEMSGLELLERFRSQHADCEVIMLTGNGTIDVAVSAMKLGAFDFLTKPFSLANLEELIKKAYERKSLKKENAQLKSLLKRTQSVGKMIGESPAMEEVYRLIQRAGPSEKAILIQGESGTGKELVAQALHQNSPRADKPLVVINCAALPETLLESELFGHEKGSFTGAVGAKPGLFEVADGGTLFIDEIGELPGVLQAKLLRTLEDGSLRRIGSLKERRVNVRLLAATNRNLAGEVKEGRFREDLFYRINVLSLQLPPLRDRNGDVGLLLDHFVGPDWSIEADARRIMLGYRWPGNVRQLINAIERAKIMADDQVIHPWDLPPEVRENATEASSLDELIDSDELATIERSKVVDVLRRVGGNKAQAARILGIDRRKVYRLIEKHGIENVEFSEG